MERLIGSIRSSFGGGGGGSDGSNVHWMVTATSWGGTAVAGVLVTGLVLFPLQVKYEAPDASMKEIYQCIWDVIINTFDKTPRKHQDITTEELEQKLKDDDSTKPELLIVDTRPEYSYRESHIPGAILMPFNKFRDDFHTLPKDKSIVLTCDFGHYSVVAANKLTKAGYRHVFDYTKGMEDWLKLKKPLESGIPATSPYAQAKDTQGTSTVSISSYSKAMSSNRKFQTPVYLDYNATTPIDPRVLDKMMPYLTNQYGNAASIYHSFGTDAERAVHRAREQVAHAIGASNSKEIVFTSGASESNNLAIKGYAMMYQQKYASNKVASQPTTGRHHIITCVTEHKAVLDPCKALQRSGDFDVTYLPVGKDGRIQMEDLKRAIRPSTILVSIMLANNEIGVIHPFREIGALCHSRGIVFHTDGTQGVGKIDLDVMKDDIDMMSISAHKIYGPKGAGALYVRDGIQLTSQIDGGGHEFGKRSGTLNVAGIVGLGESCHLAVEERETEQERIRSLRDRLLQKLSAGIPDHQVNGSMIHRLAGNLHMSFANVTSEQILMELNDVAISSGSACNSRKTGPSHVITELAMEPGMMDCTLRFGVGRFTTKDEIDYVAHRLTSVMKDLRSPASKNKKIQ